MTGDADGAPRTATVSVLFCDLVGSTERQARLGDDRNDEFRRRLFTALREAIGRTRGEEIKNTGDGLMVVFRHSAADAVACALAMHELVASVDADDPVKIYVGISAGEAIEEDRDWFGTPVNEAARLCAAATPGQTLTNEVVRALVGSRGSFGFRSVGAITLKGLPAPVAAVEVVTGLAGEPIPAPIAEPTAPDPPRPRGRKRLIGGAIAAAAVVVVAVVIVLAQSGGSKKDLPGPAAAGGAKRNYPVKYIATACPADDLAHIPGLTCGTLTVPEDRSKPNGRVVKLGVYRAPARGKATSDPAIDFGADDLSTSPARDHSEEIQVAERGYGGAPTADPVLTCPEFTKVAGDGLVKPPGDVAQQKVETAAIRACHARWTRTGVDLNKYDYLTVGADGVDLVGALHLQKVNLVSGYVATIAALQVVRRLPDAVRTLTLQEPVAPGRSALSDPTRFLSDALNNYVALCQADTACKTTFPDLARQVRRLNDYYRTHARVVQGDDGDGHKHAVLLDADRSAMALYSALNQRDTYPLIAAAISAKNRGGVADTLVAGQVVAYNAPMLDPDYPWGTVLSGQCSYEIFTVDAGSGLSKRTLPYLSGVDNGFTQRMCKAWPVREIGDVAFDDPSSTVPTLIVTPTLTPGADPQWADIFRRGLPNATVLTFPTLDGAILRTGDPPCLATIRRAFLADPNKPIDAPACERQSPPIKFVASVGG